MSLAENSTIEAPPSPRIDHLSFLPSELLHSIFESAYSDDSPEAPLSKQLYPFFEQHLYRKVSLFSPRQVDLFLSTISAHPERGHLAKSLEFDGGKDDIVESLGVLEALFPLLPNLLHLDLRAEHIEVGARSKNLFSSLSSVASVTTTPFVNDSGQIVLDHFAFLATLPSLSDLNISDWPPSSEYIIEEEEEFKFKSLRHLSIEGDGAEENTIKALVDLCPTLLSIDLNTTWVGGPVSYGDALGVLPSTIHSLRLGSEYASIFPRDHLLPRFNQLRFLDLDKGCYSTEIHTILAHLPLLVEIRLGGGTISPSGFLNLLSSPTRLNNLEQITLDLDFGRRGRRISDENRSTVDGDDKMTDWKLSEDILDGTDEFAVELTQLVSAAESNGVEVRGTVHEALALVKDYWIEASNRAILLLQTLSQGQELIQEDFDRLRDIRQSAIVKSVSLPQLDIDSLNRTQLKLVRIDLPERNWYMYCLENEGGSIRR